MTTTPNSQFVRNRSHGRGSGCTGSTDQECKVIRLIGQIGPTRQVARQKRARRQREGHVLSFACTCMSNGGGVTLPLVCTHGVKSDSRGGQRVYRIGGYKARHGPGSL
eukprot:scaffold237152_cov30-Tisochrysis_lutea.AAC.2